MNTKRKQKIVRSFFLLMLSVVFMAVTIFGGGFSAPAVYAASNDDLSFDETYVMDDLEGMTINGKAFDIADYGFDESRNTGVVLFTEYCYSFYANKQSNYGLYVYVWNPQGLQFDLDSPNNKIEFGTDPDYTEHYTKYSLDFLSVCEESNYEGLFYKFKVYMTDSQRTALLNSLDSSERFYHVSGIELVTAGDTNATDWAINLEYRFSGYSAGYGSNDAVESTLVCNTEQGEVLTLDVYPTVYHTGVSNGDNIYSEDLLYSVYFSVPNDIIEEYGELTAVHATWLNAMLVPALVTGNSDAYNAISAYIGESVLDDASELGYFYLGAHRSYGIAGISTAGHSYGYSYNAPAGGWTNNVLVHEYYGDPVNPLYFLFFAEGGINGADTHVVSSDKILERIVQLSEQFGGELVNGKYSQVLFSSVDEAFTEKNIHSTDEFSLGQASLTNDWFRELMGMPPLVDETSVFYEDVQAIQAVHSEDITGNAETDCENLYIFEDDYTDFCNFVETSENNNETVYLFRYQVESYIAQEATLFETGSIYGWQEADTNAYFFQETVSLDFDIIDVTFTNGGVDTVIPVVASPIDVVPDATPPLVTTTDTPPWWAYVIVVVAELIVLLLLRFIFCTVCGLPKWVWWILFAVVVVLDIFFITTFAWWVYSLF